MATFRDVLGYYRPYWPMVLLSTAAITGFQLMELLPPYVTGQILNVLSGQPVDPLLQQLILSLSRFSSWPIDQWLYLQVLLVLVFLTTVVRAPIQPWLGTGLSWTTALQARRDYFQKSLEKLLTLPLSFYEDNNSGRIASRISGGIANHTWGYGEIAGQLIPKLFRVAGIFVMLLLMEWRIALLFLVSFVVILGFNWRSLRHLIRQEKLVESYHENTQSHTAEIVNNIKTVKAFVTEQAELKRQKRRFQREFQIRNYRIHHGYVWLNVGLNTIVQGCLFGVLTLALIATLRHQISLGHFITTLTIANMAYGEIGPIHHLSEIFARRYASMLRFHEFLQEPTGSDAVHLTAEVESTVDSASDRFTGKVDLSAVSFAYHPDRPVLQDVNLLIHPCQTVALVGRSGSGKSTLIKLLLRYFEPAQGQILIDGEDIGALAIDRYRRRLAIVHQEVDVFNGSVLDNLIYGNSKATIAQVQEACQIAQADAFIQQLPQGYSTLVGERGVRLSGGQRQRLGIARALLVDPDVLIFDEATSSLDSESELAIQQAMTRILGTRTTIIIAHRLSTIRDADQIVVLDQGHIVEVGSHDQLLQSEGLYQRLHSLQMSGELR